MVTAAYIFRALTAAAPSNAAPCRAAASAALAAAGRISDAALTGDDAAPQHLSAARRLLQELQGQS